MKRTFLALSFLALSFLALSFLALSFLVATLATGVAFAQSRLGVDATDAALVERWLRTNCLGPEGDDLVRLLRARAAQLEPAFDAAVAQGPTEAEIGDVREAARRAYARERAALADPSIVEALPRDRVEAFRAVTERDFVQREVESFVNGYRSNAMSGLAVVGGAATLERLRAMARSDDRGTAIAAQGALALRESLSQR